MPLWLRPSVNDCFTESLLDICDPVQFHRILTDFNAFLINAQHLVVSVIAYVELLFLQRYKNRLCPCRSWSVRKWDDQARRHIRHLNESRQIIQQEELSLWSAGERSIYICQKHWVNGSNQDSFGNIVSPSPNFWKIEYSKFAFIRKYQIHLIGAMLSCTSDWHHIYYLSRHSKNLTAQNIRRPSTKKCPNLVKYIL